MWGGEYEVEEKVEGEPHSCGDFCYYCTVISRTTSRRMTVNLKAVEVYDDPAPYAIGVTTSYRVRAKDAAGNYSPYSNVVSVSCVGVWDLGIVHCSP